MLQTHKSYAYFPNIEKTLSQNRNTGQQTDGNIKNAQKMKIYKLYIDKKTSKVYIKFVTTYRREKKKLKYLSEKAEKRFYIFFEKVRKRLQVSYECNN